MVESHCPKNVTGERAMIVMAEWLVHSVVLGSIAAAAGRIAGLF
jgi:hypothetical protein